MGNSEFRSKHNSSEEQLTQSVITVETYLQRIDKQQSHYNRNYYRRSNSDTNMSRRISGWKNGQRKQKLAQMEALEKEKRISAERERFFTAVIGGDQNTVNHMLQRHIVDVNCSDENHLTALHHAAMHLKPEMMALLIQHGADPNAYDMKGGFTPVHWVVINSNPEMSDINRIGECLESLARGGCNINSRDFNQATPLHFAARKDDKMVVDALMRLGADPNAVDVLGRTCASVAKSEETKILIIKLADLRARAIYHVLEIPPSV